MVQNDQALLTSLNDSGLDFVVIGGVCAVYHGVSVVSFILEICCRFGVESLQRIESALRDLHPFHRLTPERLPLEETRTEFEELKNLFLQTDFGKLDCYEHASGVGDFEAVRKQSVLANFSYGKFRFLNLNALIASKEASNTDYDCVVLPQLRAIKERLEQRPHSKLEN
jgi:hypothetical protein